MKHLKNVMTRFWKDESAQGATEYILLLVVVVALVLAFRQPILDALKTKTGDLTQEIQNFGK